MARRVSISAKRTLREQSPMLHRFRCRLRAHPQSEASRQKRSGKSSTRQVRPLVCVVRFFPLLTRKGILPRHSSAPPNTALSLLHLYLQARGSALLFETRKPEARLSPKLQRRCCICSPLSTNSSPATNKAFRRRKKTAAKIDPLLEATCRLSSKALSSHSALHQLLMVRGHCSLNLPPQ